MTRFIKRGGKVWIRMFPTSRSPRSWLKLVWVKKRCAGRVGCGIKPGKILFEMEGVPLDVATEAMRLAAMKLAIPTKLVRREFEGM